jgi:protein TonB
MKRVVAVVAVVAVAGLGSAAWAQQPQPQASEQTLLSRIANEPSDVAAHLELIKIYLSANRLAEAEQQLTRALMAVRQQRLTARTPDAPVTPRPGAAPQMAALDQAPLRVGGEIREPKLLQHVPATYPDIAQAANVQGIVILETTVGGDGRVADVKVLRSSPLLDQAAIDAVRQWVYTPTLLNGKPVPVVMTVTVNFSLR